MKHIKVLIAVMVFCCGQLLAQPMEVDKVLAAQKEMEKKEYYTALKWYIDAYEDGEDNIEDNVDVIHNIAALYQHLRNYRKSASWYRKLMKKDKEGKYPNAGYFLGYALKISGKYEESKKAFDAFMASTADEKLKQYAAIEKAGVVLAESLPDEVEGTEVQNKTTRAFNSAYTEWSPFLASETELYYTGLSSDKLVIKKEAKGNYFSKLYKTTFDGKKWSEGKAVDAINMYGVHTGNVTMSDDRKQLYFTRCLMTGQDLQVCDIYVAEVTADGFGKPVKVTGINDDSYTSKQPAYGKVNGKDALFFTSNMPGSKDWDIYYAMKKSATEYEAPIRLGDNINTIAADETPFYHGDRLYFASKGHPSIGGYDIFTAEQDGLDFKKAENLGKGVNTPSDELYYVLNESGYTGFVVSNRKKAKSLGEGETFDKEDRWRTSGDDIFQITYDIPIIADLDVRTYDKSKEPVKGITVTLVDLTTGKSRSQFNPRGNTFAFALENDRKYRVVANIDCYFADSTEVSTEDIKASKTFLTEMFLGKVPPVVTKRIVKKTKPMSSKSAPIVLKSILFDLSKSNIRPDAEPDLQRLAKFMSDYPEMVIELSSHTDSRGNDLFNERLAQRRANSSKQYLVDKMGIAADRIVAVGKGEKELLNQCADGVKCSEEEHQVNRRTEFKIISGPDSIVTDVFEAEVEEVEEIIETPCVPTEKGSTGMIRSDEMEPPTMEELEQLPVTELVFNDETHDFGEIKKGDKVEHTFTFTNNGNSDLHIEFAAGSCGCTVPAFPKDPIPPGGSGAIKVVYDSKDKEVGKVDKQSITVIANTEPIVTEVSIQAKIVD